MGMEGTSVLLKHRTEGMPVLLKYLPDIRRSLLGDETELFRPKKAGEEQSSTVENKETCDEELDSLMTAIANGEKTHEDLLAYFKQHGDAESYIKELLEC